MAEWENVHEFGTGSVIGQCVGGLFVYPDDMQNIAFVLHIGPGDIIDQTTTHHERIQHIQMMAERLVSRWQSQFYVTIWMNYRKNSIPPDNLYYVAVDRMQSQDTMRRFINRDIGCTMHIIADLYSEYVISLIYFSMFAINTIVCGIRLLEREFSRLLCVIDLFRQKR